MGSIKTGSVGLIGSWGSDDFMVRKASIAKLRSRNCGFGVLNE